MLHIINFVSITKDSIQTAFFRGMLYVDVALADEEINLYTTKKIVELTMTTVTTEVSRILCKVMLYPLNDDPAKYLVIDHQRPFAEIQFTVTDVIVPLYPAVGDMVQICGEDDDIWYGHILEVNEDTRICQVHFYTEDPTCTRRYQRETHGREARESISWDSLIQCVKGTWERSRWRKE